MKSIKTIVAVMGAGLALLFSGALTGCSMGGAGDGEEYCAGQNKLSLSCSVLCAKTGINFNQFLISDYEEAGLYYQIDAETGRVTKSFKIMKEVNSPVSKSVCFPSSEEDVAFLDSLNIESREYFDFSNSNFQTIAEMASKLEKYEVAFSVYDRTKMKSYLQLVCVEDAEIDVELPAEIEGDNVYILVQNRNDEVTALGWYDFTTNRASTLEEPLTLMMFGSAVTCENEVVEIKTRAAADYSIENARVLSGKYNLYQTAQPGCVTHFDVNTVEGEKMISSMNFKVYENQAGSCFIKY